MRNLAVISLKPAQEFQCGSRGSKVSIRIQRKRRPHGVASEVPGKPRALTRSRSPIASNQTCSQERIVHQALQHADARPIVRLLQLSVRKFDAYGSREI